MNRTHRLLNVPKCSGGMAAILLLGVFRAYALDPNEWHSSQTLEVSAAGLVRINIPPATLNVARPSLEDLRLLDPAGNPVPYLIDTTTPKYETTMRPIEFHSSITSGATQVILKTGTTAPLAHITLETPATQFVKGVNIEGSHDGKTWTLISSGQPIFRNFSYAVRPRLLLPNIATEFLRLTIDDSRSEPVPFTGAELLEARENAPKEPVDAQIKSNEETLGVTHLHVDLGAPNMTIASLRIKTSDPLFTRSVSVAVPQLVENDTISESTIGGGVIYRVNANGKNEANLEITVEQPIPTRDLVLLIDNGDSPPLSIDRIDADRRPTRLIFFANQPGRYILLSGNPQCPAPRYDLPSLGKQLRNANATELALSPLTGNADYKAPQALAAVATTGAKIDTGKWKFRKALPASEPGVQQVELDPELLAHSLSNQGDLRIVRGEHQMPFLFDRPSITRTLFLKNNATTDSAKPRLSRWSLKLPQPALPLQRVICTSSSPLFHRQVRLWEEVADERGDKYARELGRATWDQTPASAKREFVIALDERPQSDTVLLETENGDNPPIELRDFRGTYPVARCVFKADRDPAQPIWLYYGNPGASAPHYDLSLASAELLRAERINIVAGAEENLTSPSDRLAETVTGSTKYIFWGALGLVVITLLIVMSRLLPKSAS